MIFKIYDCDFGVKVNGVSYDFEHVAQLTITDPEKNRLTRGANARNSIGLAYKEGSREAKTWEIPIINMSAALKDVLDGVFENQTRVEVYCIARSDGSSKIAKNAILQNRPQQLSIDDALESMNVSLMFETFDSSEKHRS